MLGFLLKELCDKNGLIFSGRIVSEFYSPNPRLEVLRALQEGARNRSGIPIDFGVELRLVAFPR